MRSIFVSYRRSDAEGEAGRLFADLVSHFGEASVFMDVAAIDIGRDFRKAIDESVAECGVLLAVIGRDWIDARNEEGNRRLDDWSDFVRLEIASALKRDVPVIPVLVRGAKMPRAEQLPDDLKELAYRHCVELTHARWGTDLQVLIKGLDREINRDAKPPATWWKSRTAVFALLTIALVAAIVATYKLRPKQTTVPAVTGGTPADAASKIEPPATAEVPSVLGMSLQTAEQTLRERRLKLGNVSRQPRPDVAKNIVLNEFPKPSERARVGSPVDLEVSEEAPSVPVASNKGTDIKASLPSRQGPPPSVTVEAPPVPQVSPTSASVTISRATCTLTGALTVGVTFQIEMAGRVTVPVGQKYLLYAEALSGPDAVARWRPSCQSWSAASPSDGALWNVSCVHRPNDPTETEWQTTTNVLLQSGLPTSVFAGVISDEKKAGGAARPLTCRLR